MSQTRPATDTVAGLRRYGRIRRTMITELCSDPGDGEQLRASLAFTPHISAPPLLEFAFITPELAMWAHTAIEQRTGLQLHPPAWCRDIVHMHVALPTLDAAGIGDPRDPTADAAEDLSVLRGALVAAGLPCPAGIMLTAPTPATSAALAETLERLHISHRVAASSGAVCIIIPAPAAISALAAAGAEETAGAYRAELIDASTHPSSAAALDAEIRRIGAKHTEAARRAAAASPAFRGTQIAALGDLNQYRITPKQRLAAECFVTDARRTVDDIAAWLGTDSRQLRKLLTRFWERVEEGPRIRVPSGGHSVPLPRELPSPGYDTGRGAEPVRREAENISALGDLAVYRLTARQQQVAEAVRAQPDRTYAEVSELLGLTGPGSLRGMLDRFWGRVHEGPRRTQSGSAPSLVSRRTVRPRPLSGPSLSPALVARNAERTREAGAADARNIRALGDLTRYALPDTLRQAAEQRREHPDLPLSAIADQLGITKDTYSGRLRRFWAAVNQRTALAS